MSKSWIWSAIGVGVLGVGSLVAYLILQPKPLPETILYGNGHIEGTDVRIAAEVSGRVVESRLVEGTQVKQGDVVIRIAPEDYNLRLAQAKAEEAAARQSAMALDDQLDTVSHHAKTAATDLARNQELATRGNLSQQNLDRATNVDKEARGQLAGLQSRLDQARAQLDAAAQAVALAQRNVEKASVVSPVSGTVTARLAEEGEVVAAGEPLGVVVNLTKLELKVYMAESELAKLRVGAPARIAVDAFPGRFFDAQVKTIDSQAQFTPRDIHMPEERTRTVFGVTLSLNNPEGGMHPGMPADAWILWKEAAAWPPKLFVPE